LLQASLQGKLAAVEDEKSTLKKEHEEMARKLNLAENALRDKVRNMCMCV